MAVEMTQFTHEYKAKIIFFIEEYNESGTVFSVHAQPLYFLILEEALP